MSYLTLSIYSGRIWHNINCWVRNLPFSREPTNCNSKCEADRDSNNKPKFTSN